MATADQSISIFSLLEALRRRKMFVLIPTILLTAGFAFYAYTQPNRFRATALIAAEQTTPPEYLKHVAPPPLNIQDHLWTVREVLFSPPLLEEAARQLKQYHGVPGKLPESALEEFKTNINIKVDGEHTFQLAFDALDRNEAMNVTNKLAELFTQQASAKREEKNDEAEGVINGQIDALTKRLEQQGKQLHDYKGQNAHELPEHVDDNIRAAQEAKQEFHDREMKISDEEAKKTSIQKEILDLEAKGVVQQPMVHEKTAAEIKLDDLRITERELSGRYTSQHPDVIKVRRQIADLEKEIASQPVKGRTEPSATYIKYLELKSELDGINQRVEGYRRDMHRISADLASASHRVEAAPQHEKVIEDMKREYQVGESQFHALLDKQLDAKLAKGLASSDSGIAFAIVEPANLPTTPFSPQRERLLLMGICAGLGLGLVMAFVLEQNDTTFGTVDDFQAYTTLPVIGVIPNVSAKGKKGRRAPIITITEPDSVAAEQYRLLSLKVSQQCESANSKVVMITSSAGGEGKSLTAINIAVALAATTQKKVLLVDADMRKPRIHEYLGFTVPPAKGFYNLLQNPDARLEDYIEKAHHVDVIPGVVPSSNPVAALTSPRARTLFDKLKQDFSIVIVDAPPTLPIADSHLLSGLSDKVLFVIRARQTPRELFQHAADSFDASNLLGAVLNDVDYQRSRYAYAYEYYKKTA